MSPEASPQNEWTPALVEQRLIATFEKMPGAPVFGVGGRMRALDGGRTALTDVLDWADLLADDTPAQRYLWAWARCRASKASFGAYCTALNWKRATAEDGRRRGARAIAARLSARGPR